MKKRIFQVLSVVLGVVIFILVSRCGTEFFQDNSTDSGHFSDSIFAMDTYMEIAAFGEQSEKAVLQAMNEIERLEDLLSAHKLNSEVYLLNQGECIKLSQDLENLFQKSAEISDMTEGLFDITIYPVLEAWGFPTKKYQIPTKETIASLTSHVDYRTILFEEHQKMKLPEAVKIDFGGIAKGYLGDVLADLMDEMHIESAMLNLGGNIRVIGRKMDGSLWRVGIQSPLQTDDYLGIVACEDTSVVTSGAYQRFFEMDGKKYHHIINPKTGYPAESALLSVTIICEDGVLADGLSTALFIMGKEQAIDFWRQHQNLFDFVIYTQNKELLISKGMQDCFQSDYSYQVIE